MGALMNVKMLVELKLKLLPRDDNDKEETEVSNDKEETL